MLATTPRALLALAVAMHTAWWRRFTALSSSSASAARVWWGASASTAKQVRVTA
jgi:hypothetical protein